jgi:hypothetical protein
MHSIPQSDDTAYQHACSKTFPGSDYLNNFDLSAKHFNKSTYEKDYLRFSGIGTRAYTNAGTEGQKTGGGQT